MLCRRPPCVVCDFIVGADTLLILCTKNEIARSAALEVFTDNCVSAIIDGLIISRRYAPFPLNPICYLLGYENELIT